MKKAAKNTDFEYKCFPCRKQDNKARSYLRSYDFILHMVNTHKKYPIDPRHNAYYAADGSDLRDATEEEREKYRLAALHKRRKPDAESLCGKNGRATAVMHAGKCGVGDTQQRDSRRRERDLSRDKDDRGIHHKEAGDKGGGTSSRYFGKGRKANYRDCSKTNVDRREEERDYQQKSPYREKRHIAEEEAVDDDEQDRRKMAEIVRRMEERKAAEDSEGSRQKPKDLRDTVAVVDVPYAKYNCGSTDTAKAVDKRVANFQCGTQKAAATRKSATTTNVAQCDAARQWVAEKTLDTSTVTQGTGDKGLT